MKKTAGVIRLIWRIPALIAGCIFWMIPATLLVLLFPYKLDIARRCNWTMSGYWARTMLLILGVKVEICGDIPENMGVLIAPNHTGYLDIPIHCSIRGVRFAPKKELRSWPFINLLIGLAFPVWIDRKSRASSAKTLEEFRKTVTMGYPLVVYPEGTSTDGLHGLREFKTTPFEVSVTLKCPVLPVITHYIVDEGEMNPAWYGDQEFLPHLTQLLMTKNFRCRLLILPQIEPGTLNRKELAQIARSKMLEAYNKEFGTSFV